MSWVLVIMLTNTGSYGGVAIEQVEVQSREMCVAAANHINATPLLKIKGEFPAYGFVRATCVQRKAER